MMETLSEEFLKYSELNQLEKVRDCLSRGVDVNTVSEDYVWSALAIAAHNNYLELLDVLLSQPDIKINNTLLHQYCQEGNPEILARLVQVPWLDLNTPGPGFCLKSEDTPAIKACKAGRTECVQILADTGRVDWNKPDELGRLRYLRGFGGFTPLNWALRRGFSDIVEILVKQPKIDFNVKTNNGETLANAAVNGGEVKFLKTLVALESFDDWNVPTEYGNTPIMDAVKDDNTEIVEILLRCPRVDLDVVDNDEKHLEENADTEVMKDLLWTSTTVRRKMICRNSLLALQAGSVSSLQSLARDAVMLILSTNNTRERLVTPLVDRLGQNITRRGRDLLLASYSERRNWEDFK